MNIEFFKRSFEDGIRLAVCVPFEQISSWYALCAEHNITDSAGRSVYENNYLCSLAECTYSPDDDPMCFFDEFIPEAVIELNNDRFSETIMSSLDGMLHGFQ